jgi:hypothetical protein
MNIFLVEIQLNYQNKLEGKTSWVTNSFKLGPMVQVALMDMKRRINMYLFIIGWIQLNQIMKKNQFN